MRQMKDKYGTIVNVIEWWQVINYWEYYITDDKENDDIVRAVVYGEEIELGDISKSEIKPYVRCKTDELEGLMPAPGWSWIE